MGVKYRVEYKSIDDVQWRLDIFSTGYNASPIPVRGQSENACIITYQGEETDEPFDTFFKGTADLNLINEDNIDIDELQNAQEKDFKVIVYRKDIIRFTGYLKPEDIQRPYVTRNPSTLTISFMCGLSMLDAIPYTHLDLLGTGYESNRCPMNYVRNILFNVVNLGLPLPIRWTNQVQNTFYSDDFFTGGVRWSPFNEGFYTYQQGTEGKSNGPYKSCGYVLRSILKAVQCRIVQTGGKWVIRRVTDISSLGRVNYNQIAGDMDRMVLHSGQESLTKTIGRKGYRMLNENAVITVKPGIKSFKAIYTANVRDNILPNGNQDILYVGTSFLYWGSYDYLEVTTGPSLDGRDGYAATLYNYGTGGDMFYTLVSPGSNLKENGLPIDAYTLVPLINFGFTFSPLLGFPYAPDDPDKTVIWDTNPLQIMVVLNMDGKRYYLNEFGFWVQQETFISIVVDNLRIGEIAKVDFDKFQGIKIPQPAGQPVAGSTCDLQVIFRVKAGQRYAVDNIYFKVEPANDVYEVFNDGSRNTLTDDADLQISSSFGGYFLSNFMSAWYNSDKECRFNDGAVYSGTLTGLYAQAVMRYRYKSSQIYNGDINVRDTDWTFDEIYTIDGLLGKKFLPLNAKYNTEKAQVSIVAIECRNDKIKLRESFYSSNDNQGSN